MRAPWKPGDPPPAKPPPGLATDTSHARGVLRTLFDSDDRICFLLINRFPKQGERRKVQWSAMFERAVGADVASRFEARNRDGWDIYFCVNPVNEPRRRPDGTIHHGRARGDITRIAHVHTELDLDGPDVKPVLKQLREDVGTGGFGSRTPPLTAEWSSSPNHFHMLWNISPAGDGGPGMALETAEDINRLIAARYGGDFRSTDPTRVLRLPGFYNHKAYLKKVSLATEEGGPDPGVPSRVVLSDRAFRGLKSYEDTRKYSLDEFGGLFAAFGRLEAGGVGVDVGAYPSEVWDSFEGDYGSPVPGGASYVHLSTPGADDSTARALASVADDLSVVGYSGDSPAGPESSDRPSDRSPVDGRSDDASKRVVGPVDGDVSSERSDASSGRAAVFRGLTKVMGIEPKVTLKPALWPPGTGDGKRDDSQSGRDWRWTCDRLREGRDPDQVVEVLYQHRLMYTPSVKQRPADYAVRTVWNACAKLELAGPTLLPDDLRRKPGEKLPVRNPEAGPGGATPPVRRFTSQRSPSIAD